MSPPTAKRPRALSRPSDWPRTTAATAPATATRSTGCQQSVASAVKKPMVSQRRWAMASIAQSRKSTIDVFSRGPSEAYAMNPWQPSRLAAAATPASRDRKTSRPRRYVTAMAAIAKNMRNTRMPTTWSTPTQPDSAAPMPGMRCASGPARLTTATYGGTPSATCWPPYA